MATPARTQTTDPARQAGAPSAAPVRGGTQTAAAPPLLGYGNQMRQADQSFPPASTEPTVTRADEPARVADALHQALESGAEPEAVLKLLRGRTEAFSQAMKAEYDKRYGSLEEKLEGELDDDQTVHAFALLHFPTELNDPTFMALALVGSGTRDDAVLDILYRLNLTGRQNLERNYDKAFGKLGNGSLRKDIEAAFRFKVGTWRQEKALMLLERDLTDADELYFDTVGVHGTNSDAAVKRLIDVWEKGPEHFHQMVLDWDKNLVQKGLAERDLPFSIWQEFVWDNQEPMVRQILAGYAQYRKGNPKENTPEQAQTNAELGAKVAQARTLVATGGLGTNEEHVNKAALHLYKVRMAPIAAAEQKGESTDSAWAAWEKERQQYLDYLADGEMDEDSADFARVQLMLMHDPRKQAREAAPAHQLPVGGENLSLTDQLWLAWQKEHDYAKSLDLIIKAWATGVLDKLATDLAQGKTVGGRVVRTPYKLHLVVKPEDGLLVIPGWSDTRRGGEYVWKKLQEGKQDPQLKAAHGLLTADGISTDLQESVIKYIANKYLRTRTGSTPQEKLLTYVRDEYGKSPTIIDFEALLKPPQNDAEKLELQVKESVAKQPGTVTRLFMELKDAIDGEDKLEIEAEQLARLKYLVQVAGKDPYALKWLVEQTGVKNVQELLQHGFDSHKAALGKMVELRNAIIDAGKVAVELVVAAVLTYVTAGTALAFLPGIASTLAGIGVKEAALGDEYQSLSDENISKVALALASTAAQGLVKSGMNSLLSPQTWKEVQTKGALFRAWDPQDLSSKAEFFRDVVADFTGTAMDTVVTSDKFPSGEEIAQTLATFGAGLAIDELGGAAKEKVKRSGSVLREHFYPALAKGLVTGTGNLTLDWAIGGIRGKTADQMADELTAMINRSIRGAITATSGAMGAGRRKAAQTKRDEAAESKANESFTEAQLANQTYQSAVNGGKHSSLYRQYKAKETNTVLGAISTFAAKGDQLLLQLARPQEANAKWNSLTPEKQQAYVVSKAQEIRHNAERIAILRAILLERGIDTDGKPLFQHQ